jgi:hypothetical protein
MLRSVNVVQMRTGSLLNFWSTTIGAKSGPSHTFAEETGSIYLTASTTCEREKMNAAAGGKSGMGSGK